MQFTIATLLAIASAVSAAPLDARGERHGQCSKDATYSCESKAEVANLLNCVNLLNGNVIAVPITALSRRGEESYGGYGQKSPEHPSKSYAAPSATCTEESKKGEQPYGHPTETAKPEHPYGGYGSQKAEQPKPTGSYGGYGSQKGEQPKPYGGYSSSSEAAQPTGSYGGYGSQKGEQPKPYGGYSSSSEESQPTATYGGYGSQKGEQPQPTGSYGYGGNGGAPSGHGGYGHGHGHKKGDKKGESPAGGYGGNGGYSPSSSGESPASSAYPAGGDHGNMHGTYCCESKAGLINALNCLNVLNDNVIYVPINLLDSTSTSDPTESD